jgi:PAS domain S-box-containing protein
MKKIRFPYTILAIMLVTIGFSITLYYQQRETAIAREVEKLKAMARYSAFETSILFNQLKSELNETAMAGHFANILKSPYPYDSQDRIYIRRFYARFQDLIEEICIFSNPPKCKTIVRQPGNYYIFSSTVEMKSDMPTQPGLYLKSNKLYLVIKSFVSEEISICLTLSIDRLINKGEFYNYSSPVVSRMLFSHETLTHKENLSLRMISDKINASATIPISGALKKSFSNAYEHSEKFSVSHLGNRQFYLVHTPLTLNEQEFSLILIFDKEETLAFINSTHKYFIFIMLLIVLFLFLSLFLKFTLDKQTIVSSQLSEQKDLFYLLINSMPIGVAVKEVENELRYLVCNQSAAKIFGKSVKEIEGKKDEEIFPTKVVSEELESDNHLIINGKMEVKDKILRNFGQGGIWLRSVKLPIYDRSGNLYLILHICEDISESVKLENQLQHVQRMDEIGKLAGGIAHEFNNLLQVIIGYCDFIRSEENFEAIFSNVEQIENASNNAMNLTKQLLTYSRKNEPEKHKCDLNDIVSHTMKMLKRIIDKGINFRFSETSEKLEIFADSSQLEQVLVNLCVNARDAMNGIGELKISTEKVIEAPEAIEDGLRRNVGQFFALLKVSDTGTGIPVSIREKIFEPFFTTKEVGKGTGLGLPIVYAIIKQHDGYVYLDERKKGGTTFLIYLPLIETADQIEEPAEGDACDTSLIKPHEKTILIAEDEDVVRLMMKRILKRHGFNYLEAADGQEALEIFSANQNKIDMLLFDVMMPRMTGKDAYDEIVKLKPHIPTLFCTGYSDELLKKELIDKKNVDLLHKPYRTQQLINCIYSLLRQNQQED